MKFILGLIFLGLLTGCETLSGPGSFIDPSLQAPTDKILNAADHYRGCAYGQKVEAQDKSFSLDCIGLIDACFWTGTGLDLQKMTAGYKGDGVTRLFNYLQDRGAIEYLPRRPLPGDLIFWDNTWDANQDGVFGNDGHTHAGLVLQVDDDATIHYLHASVTRGICEGFLNLDHPHDGFSPEGKVWNSPLYLGASEGKASNPPQWRSGELWSGWGLTQSILTSYSQN